MRLLRVRLCIAEARGARGGVGFEFRVSSFGFRVSSFGFPSSCAGTEVPGGGSGWDGELAGATGRFCAQGTELRA
jgi:hypothetical protein